MLTVVSNVKHWHIALSQLQGGWEADETVEAAAARETVEEAGVRGVIEVILLVSFLHASLSFRLLGSISCCDAHAGLRACSLLRIFHCLQADMIGAFPFSSSKAARKQSAEQGHCVAHMFVMHVAEELPTWPEGSERKRVWVSTNILPDIAYIL